MTTLAKLDTPAKLPPPDIQEAINKLTSLLKEAGTWADDDIDLKQRLLDLTVLIHDSLRSLQWDQEWIKPAIHAWFTRLGDPALPWDGYARSLDVSFFRSKTFQDLVDKQIMQQGKQIPQQASRKRKVAFVEIDQPKSKKKSSIPTEEPSATEIKGGTKRSRDADALSSSRKSKTQSDGDKNGDDGISHSKKKKKTDTGEGQAQPAESAELHKANAKVAPSKTQPSKEPKPKAPRKEKIDANDVQHYEPTDMEGRCSNCRKDDKTCWKRKSGDFACWTCFKSKLGACDFSAISRPKKKQLSAGESKSTDKKPLDKSLAGTKSKAANSGTPSEAGQQVKSQIKPKLSEAGKPSSEGKTKQSTSKSSEPREDKDVSRKTSKTKVSDFGEVNAPTNTSISKVSDGETIARPSGAGENDNAPAKASTSKTTSTGAGKKRASKAADQKVKPNKVAPEKPNGQGGNVSEDEDSTYIPTDLENPTTDTQPRAGEPQRLDGNEETAVTAANNSAASRAPEEGVAGVAQQSAPSWGRITPAYPGELGRGTVEEELQAASLRLHQSENRAREISASVNTVVRSFVRRNEDENKIPQLEEQLSKAFREISALREDLDAEKKRSEAQLTKLNEQETAIINYANNVSLLTSVVNKFLLGAPPLAASVPSLIRQVQLPAGTTSMRNAQCEQSAFFPSQPLSGYNLPPGTNTPTSGQSLHPSSSSPSYPGRAPMFVTPAQQLQAARFPSQAQAPQAARHLSTPIEPHLNQAFQYRSPNSVAPDYPQNVPGAPNPPIQTLVPEYQQSATEFAPVVESSPARDAALAEMLANSMPRRRQEELQGVQGQPNDMVASGNSSIENSSVGTPDWPALGGKVGRPGEPLFQDPGTYIDDSFTNTSFLQEYSSSGTPNDFLQSLSSNTPIDFSSAPIHRNSGAGSSLAGATGFAEGGFGNGGLCQQDVGSGMRS